MKFRTFLIALILSLPFVLSAGLSKEEARNYQESLWEKHNVTIRKERAAEMKKKVIRIGDHSMRFESKRYGKKPKDGWNLYISMHGGGGAPAKVNDSQWKNQVRLGDAYKPRNAIYVAPRAPTNTWNLWHQAHIDPLFDRLIENLVVLEDVNPNAVYIIGYSAGGDGVYQLAPRMADRFAGACMMAGHPNETSPLGLRNLPFAIHVGAKDHGYKRNTVAAEWGKKLQKLHSLDKGGYKNQVQIHPNKGHWMNLQDRVAIPWLQKFVREPFPQKVVWKQDNVVHDTFYWLALPQGTAKKGQLVIASIEGQTISIEKAEGTDQLLLRLNDQLLDLDQPVRVKGLDGSTLFQGKVNRTKGIAKQTFEARRDRDLVFFAEIKVDLKAKTATESAEE